MNYTDLIKFYTTNPNNPNDPVGIRDYFQRVIDQMPHHVYWLNRQCITMGCNRNMLKFFGLKKIEEFVGLTYEEMARLANWTEGQEKSFKHDDMEVMETGKSKINVEEPVLYDRDGQPNYYVSSRVPLFNERGEVIGVIGISTNITEKKLLELALITAKEQAEVANKAKSVFIENMSHDIRTPITGAVGMIQGLIDIAHEAQRRLAKGEPLSWLMQEELVAQVDKYSNILMDSTDALLELCNQILEIVNLESGKVTEHTESFDLQELIQTTLELLQPVAQDRRLQLSYEIDPLVPQYVKGLRMHLGRICLNLISNALKFTKKGFIKVHIALADTSDITTDRVRLKITVSDSGIGIPADQFETIFENFARLNPSHQGTYKGSGLGLYAVKQYIHAMGGEITVSSECGQGSQFTVNIPFIVSDHSDYVKRSVRFVEPTGTSSRGHVLVVEDSPAAAMAITILLEKYGCHVTLATNGEEGFSSARKKRYDLILMDIGLPDTTGLEVTKKIRALADQQLATVPIIALTGHVNKREECITVGMQDFLNKPVQPATLEKILARYLLSKEKVEKKLEKTFLPVIDWAASLEMIGRDDATLKRLLLILAEDLPTTESVLAAGYQTYNVEKMRAELHRVLGGICYVKLPQLDHALKNFQIAIKRVPQSVEETQQIHQEVQATYEAVKAAINEFYKYCKNLT